MTELKLEVGKTYLGRSGDKKLIACNKQNTTFPFFSGRDAYTAQGRYQTGTIDHPRDLISEYIEPAQPAARTPHKWANEMHAFADGYEIEYFSSREGWLPCGNPGWINTRYRIKPEPSPLKPNFNVFIALLENGFSSYTCESLSLLAGTGYEKALRIEFNPNDQTLVSAEVVTL